MRYSVTRYLSGGGGYVAPLSVVYNSFGAAEKELQYMFITGQSIHSRRIAITDDSLHVWQNDRYFKDYVAITREDNPFFAFNAIIEPFRWYNEPFKHYWEPLAVMFNDYLHSISIAPELFNPNSLNKN